MKDVQSQSDDRALPINRVGVKNLRYPITVLDRAQELQHTVGEITMTVNLPHHFRGTHMSRFIEILNENRHDLHIDRIGEILAEMKSVLHAEEAHMEVRFPYFIEKEAPVSKARGLMEYQCELHGTLGETADYILGVEAPITTLCPCSKELSDRGAHNQRSRIHIQIRYTEFVWLEELIEIAESCASSPVYSVLKREDEKAVTEQAYDHPRFVEDMVREIALKLGEDRRICWFKVESENMESIHNHNAYAMIEKQLEAVSHKH